MIRTHKHLWQIMMMVTVTLLVLTGCGRNPILTQAEAKKMAGVFCLPTYLPDKVNPTPVFYAAGEPEIPNATVLYTNTKTSERMFVITMQNVTYTSDVMRGDLSFYDRYEHCENRFVLSNGFRVCDMSDQPIEPDFEKNFLIAGPPLITFLSWLAHQDDKWAIYYIDSSLPLEETKKIASSMCLER